MRKFIINSFVTLDEVMQAPGGPEEDPTGGFAWGGWSFNYWDDMMGQVMGESMANRGAKIHCDQWRTAIQIHSSRIISCRLLYEGGSRCDMEKTV